MSSSPYPSEQPGEWWDIFNHDRDAIYADAGEVPTLEAIVWNQRTAYDIGAGMDPQSAKYKHLNELRVALGFIAPRPPLPPFPPGSYDHTLPWTPPEDRDYSRGNAFAVTINNLPFVLGGSSLHPERLITWFFDRFPPEWQVEIIRQYRDIRKYRHFVLSWPDSRAYGCTLQQFRTTCETIKAAGLYPHVKLASKDFDPRDQSFEQWRAALSPVLEALAGVAEEYGVWEWNLFNVPGRPTVDTFKWIGNLAHQQGASFWLHFSPHVTSWFADGDPRGRYGFYTDLGTDVNGLDYQTDPAWDVPMMQARIVDTLVQFGRQGNVHKIRLFEDQASYQFDGPVTEDDGDLRGYLGCCTVDSVAHTSALVWGYGNGARMPDGSPL